MSIFLKNQQIKIFDKHLVAANQNNDLLSKTNNLLNQTNDLLSETNDLLSNTYDALSKTAYCSSRRPLEP